LLMNLRRWIFKLAFCMRVGFYFSFVSAFEIGRKDLTVGSWLTRLQATPYKLKATGWVPLHLRATVRAGEKGSHFGRFRPEPVVHPREPPVDGDAVRTPAVSKLVFPRRLAYDSWFRFSSVIHPNDH
jgi:hypothetical protein